MFQSKYFIITGFSFYLLLIVYEHLYITNSLTSTQIDNIWNGPFNQVSNERQLPNASDCLPLPPPFAKVPRIYVHIGPYKTGTTALQDYLACNTDFLKKQNTYYLGKINMYDVKRCNLVPPDFLRPLIQTPSLQVFSKLRYVMHHFRKQGGNVILSSEDIFSISKNYTSELFANFTHVYPVVGYRRYHDWLLSSYRFTFGEPKWYEMEMWKAWDGHNEIPTFRSFVGQYINKMHPTLESLHKFYEMQQPSAMQPCPQILNFHLGDVTKEFMKLITTTDSVPMPVYTNVNDERKLYAVDSEILALKLYGENKIHMLLSRRVVVDVLQHKLFLLYENSNPPLDCLSPEEERALLEATKSSEKHIIPELYDSQEGEAKLEADFRNASNRNVFCNIDLNTMLKEPPWEKLLLKLKAGKLRQDDFRPIAPAN
jgi:hypothetical protein